ncbi:MAG: RtcB family protein [Spirochaetaceae bacterium]|jgi:RNA-splicing ligase RtcB|nr:RtcB family protein [Spirochaetaceae bacterium]
MYTIEGEYNKAIIQSNTYPDDKSYSQIQQLVNSPFVEDESIVVQADYHAGAGCVIGYTQTLKHKKVCPNLVGVDIGCSVSAYKFKTQHNLDFRGISYEIQKIVPMGFSVKAEENTENYLSELVMDYNEYIKTHNVKARQIKNCIGSLGGGNHFIEINKDEDEEDTYYLTIHTGSRHFGLMVATYWQNIAIKQARHSFKGLCWLEDSDADSYLKDMNTARKVASENHIQISKNIMDALTKMFDGNISIIEKDNIFTTHNYIDTEDMTVRKGAIRASIGERCIIPMNMRDGSLIVKVVGSNTEWNNSLPHGAGRVLSRTTAKAKITINEFKQTMREAGVYCPRIDKSIVDEAPMAYKDKDEIINILSMYTDYIKIEKIIKPIFNMKSCGD